jgi:hypothetical protein
MAENLLTPQFRASYVQIFRPRKNELNGEMEYSVVAIFPKDADLKPLHDAAKAAIVEKWGNDPAKWPKPLRSPIRKNEEREKEGKLPDGYEAGGHFITLKAKQKPGLVDQKLQTIIDETKVYSGCFMRAQVRAYAYDAKGNRGVSFGLQNLQFMADGEPLSGRMRAEDAFEPVADAQGSTTEDPFAS